MALDKKIISKLIWIMLPTLEGQGLMSETRHQRKVQPVKYSS